MNLNSNIRVSSVENVDFDETIRCAIDKKYKNMPNYKFSDEFEVDDEYLPTFLAVLVPFRSYHAIVTINYINGSFDLKVCGIITDQSQISDSIVLCNLWFLDNEKVYYQAIDMFLGKDDYGDPAPIDYLLVTEKTIRKIFDLLLEYYLGSGRLMYECNPQCEEEKSLDL